MKLTILFLLVGIRCLSQSPVRVDCNSIFICLDTTSYHFLFTNAYIKDTLFYCREDSVKTTDDAYTGKYAQGQSATLEFLKPTDFNSFGNHTGECGIEFKTRLLGDLQVLEENAKQLNIKVDTSTSVYDDSDRHIAWYKTIKINNSPETYELSILEYQKEFLTWVGFTSEEINSPMTYAAFVNKVSHGHEFKRQFSEIKSVTIEGNKELLKGVSSFCKLTGLNENRRFFYNADFRIYFKQNDAINNMKIDQIEISLLTEQAKRLIKITKDISVLINNKRAVLNFK